MDDRKPLLLISDAPTSGTGLGRICRDLAVRIHENLSDVYRVGVLGWSGSGSRHFGFAQYHVEGMNQWVLPTLPDVWEDFAGKEHGIILGVWDASRFFWFSQPARSEHLNSYPLLRKWLNNAPFKRWLYCPLDASGPNDRLTFPIMQTLLGFDRILAYGPFGESVIRKTIGEEESSKRNLTNLPHGIDGTVFCERDRVLSRKLFLQITGAQSLTGNTLPVAEDELLLGIISTNQARKDFGLVLEACSILSRDRKIRLWIHTDVLERCWSIPSLLIDYGLIDRTIISLNRLPDENLSYALSACDLTIGPGAEGFGLPLLESQYCGTPVVTGSYAGGADIVPKEWQVDPDAFRYEGEYACKRPVYTAWRWASTVNSLIGKRCDRPDEYDWNNLWPRWKKWLLDGIEEKKIVSQETIRELNYAHHRTMTRDHLAADPSENARIKQLDDDSFRFLLRSVPKGGAILELGSASGGQWDVLREWSDDLTGLDLYEPAVKASQEKGLSIVIGYVEAMPFSDESFAVCVSRHVMEHVADPQKALSEIKRVLKPGGYVASVTPHRFPDLEPAHICQLTIERWVEEYRKAGFVVLSAELKEFNCMESHIVARKEK